MSEPRDRDWWRQYRIDKRDAINARLRRWNKANRDKRNAIQRRYRARARQPTALLHQAGLHDLAARLEDNPWGADTAEVLVELRDRR